MRPIILALVAMAVFPAAAGAANVRVDAYVEPQGTEPESSCSRYMQCPPAELIYTAAAGEANDVTVTRQGFVHTIRDAGASIEVGSGCSRVDAQTVTCNAEVARIALGDGADQATSSAGTVDGGDGNDVLSVLSGNGGAGDDIVTCEPTVVSCSLGGGPGADRVTGGPMSDSIFDDASGAGDDDLLDGGDGVDVISYDLHTTAVGVELDAIPQRVVAEGENDSIARFERVYGGAGDDVLGTASGVTISQFIYGARGGAGNDQIFIRSTASATGDDGNDTITGLAGTTSGFDGGSGDDRITGAEGRDRILGGGGRDVIVGGDGRDVIEGGVGDDDLSGGAGDDRIEGFTGADVLRGQEGNDLLASGDGRQGNDRLSCGAGTRDRANADRRDRVVGCERVTRRRVRR